MKNALLRGISRLVRSALPVLFFSLLSCACLSTAALAEGELTFTDLPTAVHVGECFSFTANLPAEAGSASYDLSFSGQEMNRGFGGYYGDVEANTSWTIDVDAQDWTAWADAGLKSGWLRFSFRFVGRDSGTETTATAIIALSGEVCPPPTLTVTASEVAKGASVEVTGSAPGAAEVELWYERLLSGVKEPARRAPVSADGTWSAVLPVDTTGGVLIMANGYTTEGYTTGQAAPALVACCDETALDAPTITVENAQPSTAETVMITVSCAEGLDVCSLYCDELKGKGGTYENGFMGNYGIADGQIQIPVDFDYGGTYTVVAVAYGRSSGGANAHAASATLRVEGPAYPENGRMTVSHDCPETVPAGHDFDIHFNSNVEGSAIRVSQWSPALEYSADGDTIEVKGYSLKEGDVCSIMAEAVADGWLTTNKTASFTVIAADDRPPAPEVRIIDSASGAEISGDALVENTSYDIVVTANPGASVHWRMVETGSWETSPEGDLRPDEGESSVTATVRIGSGDGFDTARLYVYCGEDGVWSEAFEREFAIAKQPTLAAPVIDAPASIEVGQDIAFDVACDEAAASFSFWFYLEDGSDYDVWQTSYMSGSSGTIQCPDGDFDPGSYYIRVSSYAPGFRPSESVFPFTVTGERPDIGAVTVTPENPTDISGIDVIVDQDCEAIDIKAVDGGMSGSGTSGNHGSLYGLYPGTYTLEVRVKLDGVWSKKYTQPIVVTEAPDAEPPVVLSCNETVQIGGQIVIELAESDQADSYHMYLYDEAGDYVGYAHTDGATLVFSQWPATARPGVYTATIGMASETYDTRDAQITLRITVEERADPPEDPPRFSTESVECTLIAVDDWDGYWFDYSTPAAEACVANYESLYDAFGYEPTWTCVQTGGETLQFRLDGSGGERTLYVYGPTTPTDATFEIRCGWGEWQAVLPVAVHAVRKAMPEGLGIPEIVDLRVGEDTALSGTILPEGWAGGIPVNLSLTLEVSHDEHGAPLENRVSVQPSPADPGTWMLHGLRPGYQRAWVQISCANLQCDAEEMVILRVADANGVVPDPVLRITGGFSELTRARAIHGIDLNDRWEEAGFGIADWDMLRRLLPGAPVWTLEHDGGDAVALALSFREDPEDDGPGCKLQIARWPDGDMEVHCALTCEWGGLSTRTTATLRLLNSDIVAYDMPQIIEATVGEPCVFAPGLALSDGSTLPATSLYASMEDYGDAEAEVIRSEDGLSCTITPARAGYNMLWIEMNCGLYECWMYVPIHVVDGSGESAPPALMLFNGENEAFGDDDAAVSTLAIAPLGKRLNAPYSLGELSTGYDMYLYNYELLEAVYHGQPEWTFTQISGEAIDAEISGEEWPVLTLKEMPAQAGDVVLRVTCSWGDMTASGRWVIHFLDRALPAGLIGPDVVALEQGDVTALYELFRFTPEDGGFNCTLWDMTCESEGVVALREGFGMYVEAVGTGYTDAVLTFFNYETSVCCDRRVRFRVTDEAGLVPGLSTMALPVGLTAIGDEAFMGIAAQRVVIPEGCGSIGSRAFADCANLLEVEIPSSVAFIADDAFDNVDPVLIVESGSAGEAAADRRGWKALIR